MRTSSSPATRRRRALAAVVGPCFLAACSADVSRHDGAREATGSVASAATSTSAYVTLCNAVNTLSSYLFAANAFSFSNPIKCNELEVSNLYFNGAEAVTGTLEDFDLVPIVSEGAYFCAIADSDGASVDSRLSSPFGGFGVTSKFEVTQRDPPNRHVHGRRVAGLSLFGVSANLDIQDIDWQFPREETNGSPQLLGSYMQVTGDSANWSFKGSVDLPVGPITVTITPSLTATNPTATMTNDGIQFSGIGTTPALSSDYLYANWLKCTQTAGCIFGVPTLDEMIMTFQHAQSCPSSLSNFSDGILPFTGTYDGAGCSSQNFAFTDTQNNWFHFGSPGAGGVSGNGFNSAGAPVTLSEPSAALTSATDPSATLAAGLGLSWGLMTDIANITVDTNVNLAGRDGFAVRQSHLVTADGSDLVTLATDLNAQSIAQLTVALTVDIVGLDLLGGPFTLSHTFTLGNSGNKEAFSSTSLPSDVVYMDYARDNAGSTQPLTTLEQYVVNGVAKSNADSARLSCVLQTTPTTATPTPPDDPGPFFNNVAHTAVNAIHPCHVLECSGNPQTERDYEWSGGQLTRQSTQSGCGICTVFQMNLCDASGQELDDSTGKPLILTSTQSAGGGCVN